MRWLRTKLGRVIRDVARRIEDDPARGIVSPTIRREMRRRNAIEPAPGHITAA